MAEIFNNIGWVLSAKDYLQLGLCINAIKAIPLTEKAIEQREKIKENKISQRSKVIAEIRKKCECALPDEYRPKSEDETH